MTVSYQGKTFPLCCTGCRDEFNDNPEKYVKKAALMAESGRGAPVKKASAGRDDGAFDGLVETPGASSKPAMKGREAAAEAAAPASKAAEPGKAVDRAARGASLLRLGQNLEKSGKTAAALTYYRQVVRDFPGTPAAAAAELRVKALAPK
ncbi:MAG: YHS domain-containing protein [Isosphaeraceae bacterium]